MPMKIVKKGGGNGTANTSIDKGAAGKKVDTYGVDSPVTSDNPAKIKIAGGLTLNLGDFNSARVDVGIELPCDPENIEEAFSAAKKWVETKVEELQSEIS